MNYNEFAESIKTKYPQYKDMDNKDLAERMIAKYPQYKDITFDTPAEEKKGIDLTPSGAYKKVVAGAVAPLRAAIYKESIPEAYKTGMEKLEEFKPAGGTADFIFDTAVYSRLPMLKGASTAGKVGAFAGNAAIQGGLPGLLEGAKEGEALEGAGAGTGIAAGVQGALNAIPGVGRSVTQALNNPRFQKGVANTLEAFTSVPSDYSKLALEKELAGNSIFNGAFDADTAYIPIERKLREAKAMLPTKEGFAQEYNRLGKQALEGMNAIKEQAGAKINEVLQGLDVTPTDISGLRNSISSTLKGFARGGEINPANIRANKEIDLINNMLGMKSKQEIGEELANYAKNNTIANALDNPEYNKEAMDIAFDALSQATGKDKQWLKSQLNAKFPQLSTQKRQEFIENLLEGADDKIDNIDPKWANYFPELNWKNIQEEGNGVDVARKLFDRIINKDFRNAEHIITPMDEAVQEAGQKYNKMLGNLAQKADKYSQTSSINQFDEAIKNLPPELQEEFVLKYAKDLDNIENITNKKLKPIDLHNIKETLYDMANYETAGGIRNDVLKRSANQVNNFLRSKFPQYQAPNDMYSLIMDVERGLDGANTIASKIKGIGSEANLLSGLDDRLKNIDTLLPEGNKFYKQAQDVIKSENEINAIKNAIGKQYERNPRLLANRTDEAFENAINDLQKKTGVNFMDDLQKLRAREAFEKWFPGQGGGSGSSQGFGNLLRTAIIGGTPTAAALTQNPVALLGLGAVSPKFAGKATIQNLGKLQQAVQGWQNLVPENIQKLLTPALVQLGVGK
jgi:hypothetical protein